MCQYPKQLKVRSGRIRNPGKQARCAGAVAAEERGRCQVSEHLQLKIRSGRIRNPGKQARCAGAVAAEERGR
ncbi:hypothetical protein, partial [Bacillus subtilis]|uniref:hypothetical protein n=1 Tax=Bacillus subtilis TaxID=1423 RepID=UPI003F83CA6F